MTESSRTQARNAVVAAALDLFITHGFEQTSVEQIAQAAGVSRSTFFRQFGGKDDVVFTDHSVILGEIREFLAASHANPWAAVCESSLLVYRHYAQDPVLARRRYAVVRQVPALREREIVTVYQYERLFGEYLRKALPGVDAVDAVAFAAAVTAVHNHVLRRLLRGSEDVPASVLTACQDDLLRRFGVHPDGASPQADDELVVAVFPRSMPVAEIARRIGRELR